MNDWNATGIEDEKREGELYLSQIIELAQNSGAHFVHRKGAWELLGEDGDSVILFSVESWHTLTDAAKAYLVSRDIPLTRRALALSQNSGVEPKFVFPHYHNLKKKYE